MSVAIPLLPLLSPLLLLKTLSPVGSGWADERESPLSSAHFSPALTNSNLFQVLLILLLNY